MNLYLSILGVLTLVVAAYYSFMAPNRHGAGVVLMYLGAVGLVGGFVFSQMKGDYERGIATDPGLRVMASTPEGHRAVQDNAETMGTISLAGWGLGVLFLIGGLYLVATYRAALSGKS